MVSILFENWNDILTVLLTLFSIIIVLKLERTRKIERKNDLHDNRTKLALNSYLGMENILNSAAKLEFKTPNERHALGKLLFDIFS